MLKYTTPTALSPHSLFRSILARLWTRLRPSQAQHQERWDAQLSALRDNHIQFCDTIDELKRLFTTGTTEVPHA